MRKEMTVTTITDAIAELEEENSRMYSYQNHHIANTMAIKALNAIQQIQAEIEGDMLFYEEDNCNDKDTGFVMGLQHTLDIIDKHTK